MSSHPHTILGASFDGYRQVLRLALPASIGAGMQVSQSVREASNQETPAVQDHRTRTNR